MSLKIFQMWPFGLWCAIHCMNGCLTLYSPVWSRVRSSTFTLSPTRFSTRLLNNNKSHKYCSHKYLSIGPKECRNIGYTVTGHHLYINDWYNVHCTSHACNSEWSISPSLPHWLVWWHSVDVAYLANAYSKSPQIWATLGTLSGLCTTK